MKSLAKWMKWQGRAWAGLFGDKFYAFCIPLLP